MADAFAHLTEEQRIEKNLSCTSESGALPGGLHYCVYDWIPQMVTMHQGPVMDTGLLSETAIRVRFS